MAEVKWIKITTNMFDDEKIRIIESMPDADSILIVWIKLLTLAGKINTNGYIFLTENIPYTDEMLSTLFNRPLNTVRLALQTFQKFGMISHEDNAIYISNWEKHQNIEGLEKIKNQNKLRQQKYREKQRALTDSNVTVTLSNGTEEDKNKNKIKNKSNNKQLFSEIISQIQNPDLKNTLLDFIEHRKHIKKPLSEKALKAIIKKLPTLNPNINNQIKILEESMINGWAGIFPLKEARGSKSSDNPDKFAKPYTGEGLSDDKYTRPWD